MCASTLVTCVILKRTSRLAQRIGRLNEQVYVLSSSGEAIDREMTFERWMQGSRQSTRRWTGCE